MFYLPPWFPGAHNKKSLSARFKDITLHEGTKVWLPDEEHVWIQAELVSDIQDTKIEVRLEDESIQTIILKSDGSNFPLLRNPEILAGADDLTTLSYLHEPEVLQNLKIRFLDQHTIYTYCGIVLMAINPYENIPMYGQDMISTYSGKDASHLEPHIYAVAEDAMQCMRKNEQDQSVIISGESGAGKTVSAKYIMRFLANSTGSMLETSIEKKVLASNPIMEAFGNAKTLRNDNSSRFGKFIELNFSSNHQLIGAYMRTYLLEKSRVVFHSTGERTYHIFYQLLSQWDAPDMKNLYLDLASKFFYTGQGRSLIVDGIDDAECFVQTRRAMETMGIKSSLQVDIFRILSGILHLGNIRIFAQGRMDGSTIKADDPSLKAASVLLGLNIDHLKKWLCHRKIITTGETVVKGLTQDEAMFGRDALAKHLFSQLFDWVVSRLNMSLCNSKSRKNFIGVLDIYGFETFDVNSFEQFCINYANEKLQQQFNLYVFKLEQEEYRKENISWSYIEFYDNQPCIDLIESKLGIIDLLDEECKMPKGSDSSLIQKLYKQHLKTCNHFTKPKISEKAFIIQHFADMVHYLVDGFVEKNRDSINEDHTALLRSSNVEIITDFFKSPDHVDARGSSSGKSSSMKLKKTAASDFKESLSQLMKTLYSTGPHYIRCIKPNDVKGAFKFDPKRVTQQLRACGVLETIRISAQGYPTRWTYQEFLSRYQMLLDCPELRKLPVRTAVDKILSICILDKDLYQLGRTKVFFRAGQVAYMERLRQDRMRAACVLIQAIHRGQRCRRWFLDLRKSALVLQKHFRGLIARRLLVFLRQTKASIIIQKTYRSWVTRTRYLKLQRSAITLQCLFRSREARKVYIHLLQIKCAIIIQTYSRGWLARSSFKRTKRKITLVQCCVRRWLARRMLKALKVEARSVNHVKELNKGLELKIISLQQHLDREVHEKRTALQKASEVTVLQERLKHLSDLQSAVNTEKALSAKLESDLAAAKLMLNEMALQHQRMLQAKDNEVDVLLKKCQKLDELNAGLMSSCSSLKEELDRARKRNAAENVDLQAEGNMHLTELRNIPSDYENLLRDNDCLRQWMLMFETNGPSHQVSGESHGADVGGENMVTIPVSRLQSLELENEQLRSDLENLQRRVRTPSLVNGNITTLSGWTSLNSLANSSTAPKDMTSYDGMSPRSSFSGLKQCMIQCTNKNLDSFVHMLVSGLNVGSADGTRPDYIAHYFFMAVRYIDAYEKEALLKKLFVKFTSFLSELLKSRSSDFNVQSFWLSAVVFLVNDLRMFASDTSTMELLRGDQRLYCLINFDLSEYVDLLMIMLGKIYQTVVGHIQEAIKPLLVPAILEYDPIPGVSCPKTMGSGLFRNNKYTLPFGSSAQSFTTVDIVSKLSSFHSVLILWKLDPVLLKEIFTRVFHHICSTLWNNLVLRKNMCHWSKGMQIRFNITQLEEWCRAHDIEEVSLTLNPLIEATKLLQVNKSSMADMDSIIAIVSTLNHMQVYKILTMYTPTNEYEPRVPSKLISAVTEKLKVTHPESELTLHTDSSTNAAFSLPPHDSALRLDRFAHPVNNYFSGLKFT